MKKLIHYLRQVCGISEASKEQPTDLAIEKLKNFSNLWAYPFACMHFFDSYHTIVFSKKD